MTQPLVSVCITTFNHADYIQDCLLSVLTQKVSGNIEILVGDDHSADETPERIKEIMTGYPGKINYLSRLQNLGPFENLKNLVQQAGGQFIAHLDGDDFWLPGKLKAQLDFLNANPDCVACYANAWVVSDDLCPIGLFNNHLPDRFDLDYLLSSGNYLNHSSLLYRSIYKDALLQTPVRFIDYQVHLNLAMKGMLGYLNVAYVVYRQASSQSMIQRSNDLVRNLYLQALLDTFEKGSILPTVRVAALSNFWARIVKDAASRLRFSWALHWAGQLKKNLTASVLRIFVSGLFHGLIMLGNAAVFRILSSVPSVGKLRIFNRR